MFVFVDGVSTRQGFARVRPGNRVQIEETRGVGGGLRQHGSEVGGQHGEGVDEFAAYFVQACVLTFLLGEFPRLVGIDVFVHDIRQCHDVAQGAGVFAVFVLLGNVVAFGGEFGQ